MLNPYIKTISERYSAGRLNQETYGRLLKNYYDTNASNLDKESLDFLESKLTELKLPLSNPGTTDGVVKQALSGLLEGFTTFGFADTPDTPTEKIINNIGHLIGLAPGVMLGGGRMLSGAAKTVGNSLIRRGGLEKNKKLVELGDKLKNKSRELQKGNQKIARKIGYLAEKASFVDDEGKLILGLRGGKPSFIDPRDGKSIYELKSIPGKIAEVVQQQGLSYLGDNKARGMKFITQGLLRNKFGEEGVARVLHEAGHVGLLMAFSNNPLATRNEEGIKGMAMAGMHGAIAGGIFGTIGQYANVSKLLTSSNPTVRKAGEQAVRKAAQGLVTRNDLEATQFVNTMVRATAGAGYGLGTSLLHDMPLEDQIYETLMGVFFSVNGRPTYENRATKDINKHANVFDLTATREENMARLQRQDWFKNESKEYKMYWEQHFDAIRQQQYETVQEIPEQTRLALVKALQRGLKDKVFSQKDIEIAMGKRSDAEGQVSVLQEMIGTLKKQADPNYGPEGKIETYNTNSFIDTTILTDMRNFKNNQTTGNEADFPTHRFTEIAKRISETPGQEKFSHEQFQLDVRALYERTKKKDSFIDNGVERVDVDSFVKRFKDKYNKTDFGKDESYIREVALTFDYLKPAKEQYLINMVPNEKEHKGKRKNMKRPSMLLPMPAVDPKKNPITKLTAGLRDNFQGFKNMEIKVVDNMQVKTGEGTVFVKPLDRIVDFAQGKGRARKPVTDNQWYMFEKELNKKKEYIHGGVADTGRIEIRRFPWAAKGKGKDLLTSSGKNNDISSIYTKLEFLYKTASYKNSDVVKAFLESKEYKRNDLNMGARENAVATLIYRMREMGIIKSDKNINKSFIESKLKQYIKMETSKYGAITAAKSQKYLHLSNTSEIPFLSGKKLGLKDDNLRGIVLEDLNPNSETDGVIRLHPKIFDAQGAYGGVTKAAAAKGSLYSPPDGKRGLIVGKYAYFRADAADVKYMNKHNMQFILYVTGAKNFHGVKTESLDATAYNPKKKTIDQDGIYPNDPSNIVTIPSKDFSWNYSIREKVTPTGKLNMMQQMYLNLNSIQFDRNTTVGREAHDAWRGLLHDAAMGDPKVNKEFLLRIKKNKSLKGLDLDKVNITYLDKLITKQTRKRGYKDLAKHLYFENKHGQLLDTEASQLEAITQKHFGQHWADSGFEASALLQRGGSDFVQKTFRNYIMSRLVRPTVDNSYSVILGPYDWKISLRKQRYSEAEKGLADNEFMLAEGAAEIMRVKSPTNGREIKLGTWWKTMSKILDKDKATLDKLSAEQLNAWMDSQYTVINRSPVMTAGNMRTLKFVGFAKGNDKRGIYLITNSRNDNMMGGADKDIDSAHLSWGLPEAIKKGFRQEHVQFEFAKDLTRNTEDYDLKDDKLIKKYVKDLEIAPKNPFGILLFGEKLAAASSARYGKTSIGIIFNEFTRIKQAADFGYQQIEDLTLERKLKGYQGIVRLNAAVGNRYIDATETRRLSDAFEVMENVKKDIYGQFKEAYGLDLAFYEKGLSDYHKAIIKTQLKDGVTYEKVSKDLLEVGLGTETYLKDIARYTKDLSLTIDPFHGYNKRNVFELVANANRFLAKNPYAQAFGIQNEQMFKNVFFNKRSMTQNDIDIMLRNPHFMYNKMAPFRVVKAITETEKFIGDTKVEFDKYLGINTRQLESFVRELIHITQQHKFMYSGQPLASIKKYKSRSKNNPNQMSYPEMVFTAKEMLKKELQNFYTKGTQGTLPPKVEAKINKRVVELFEYWHEANPFIELNFNTLTGAQKEFQAKRQQVFRSVESKLALLRNYYGGNQKKPRINHKNNPDMWSKDDRRRWNKLRNTLSAMEYEARNFAPDGPDNMMRNGAISSKVKKDIARFETKVLESLQPVEEAKRTAKIMKVMGVVEPLEYTDIDGPGREVNNQVKNTSKFTTDLIPWETLSTADNFRKELNDMSSSMEKKIKGYKLNSKVVEKELDRFSDLIYTMLKNGNTPSVIELSSMYLKLFQKLDVVNKKGIENIDWTHLRVLNNMLTNMYTDTWIEYGTRNTLHKKYVKQLKEIEKKTGNKLMPPSWVTDLQFPSQQGKMMRKVEKAAFKIETITRPKNGKFREEGIIYPTNTIEQMAEAVGKRSKAQNTLFDSMEAEFNGRLDAIRTEDQAKYNKYRDIIEEVAAYERQLGLKGTDPISSAKPPRDTEHNISLENLIKNVTEARKKLDALPEGLEFEVISRKKDKKRRATPREMVEYIKDNIQTPTMTEAYELLYESNWETLSNMLTPKRIQTMGFAKDGFFDYNTFFNIPTDKRLTKNDVYYPHVALSETFFNKYGVIVPERVKFINDVNLQDKRLQEGKETVRKHFHIDDLQWIDFQLNLLDIVEAKYGTVLADGSFGLNYKRLSTEKNKKGKLLIDEMQDFIRNSNRSRARDQKTGYIGGEEIDGKRFSKQYHPLMGQDATKQKTEFIQQEHVPRESLRYFGELVNKKTGEVYKEYKEIDIEAYLKGDIVGRFNKKEAITVPEIMKENPDLAQRVEDGMISHRQAVEKLYRNMVEKLLDNPERYNNPMYDEVSEHRVNNLARRSHLKDSAGGSPPVHAGRRTAIPVEGYDTSLEAYRKYLKTSTQGVTGQQAHLSTRLLIRHFKNNSLAGNKRIDPEVGRAWHHKLIDIARGYMNMPSIRNFELYGVSEKDMNILKKFGDSNYSIHFLSENPGYDIVDKKLINDFRMYTRPNEAEIRDIEKELMNKSKIAELKETYELNVLKINKSKRKAKEKARALASLEKKYKRTLNKKQKAMRDALYGKFVDLEGTEIRRDEIKLIDYAEQEIVLRSRKGTFQRTIKYDPTKSRLGEIRLRTNRNRDDFIYAKDEEGRYLDKINKRNIDIVHMNKSFRNFYSEETVGNFMLRLEQRANKLLGRLTDNKIQIMKDLPKDPSARHRAMLSKLNWISDMEGKFEMMSLLAHPKSAVANLYGGTTNLITDVGFDYWFKSFDEAYLVNDVFANKTYKRFSAKEGKFIDEPIKTINDVHRYFEQFGFLDANIQSELVQMKPPGDTSWKEFSNEVGKILERKFKELPIYTKDKELNKKNKKLRDEEVRLTMGEAAKKYNIGKWMVEKGAYFMRTTERHLRMKTAIAHYIKARELFTDTRGRVEVNEQFLLEYAEKGIEATQFIYHATNRPGFSNTAFGRMMTRFHPYSWNSIRRRANIITDRMMTEGYGDFEANKRFERQLSADLMVAALGTVFAASIFEYALSPPMNWAVDFSHLMFGDKEQRERAFYNQYGHPLLSPLGIITPPGARFILSPMTSLINNDWEPFWKYTFATALPFGRLGRDVLRVYDAPPMFGEFMFGIPVHQVGRILNKPEPEEEEETEIE